jgi:hypothetical protein
MNIISKKGKLVKLFCEKCKYVKWIKEKNLDRKEYTCSCHKELPEPHKDSKEFNPIPYQIVEVTEIIPKKEVKKTNNKR